MKRKQVLFSALMLVLVPAVVLAQANFNNSLHKTRNGKPFWYNSANGGFETFTNVPMSSLGCVECHGPTDADGQPYPANYSPNCIDCHPSNSAFNPDSIKVTQCYGCHGRQATEANQLGYNDVHRSRGMKCWACHTSNDIHGTTATPNSMLEPGAIEVDCDDCHTTAGGTLPDHTAWDPASHNGKIHCTSCHARTVISCYNCHFESQVQAHVKRAKQPIHGFVMLANRSKDGKVYPMTFQSLTYQGNAFAAFGPFTSHTITDSGRVCLDCHVNFGGQIQAIQQYNQTGQMKFATWNSTDSTLSWLRGIVPMPSDYQRAFKMDFITYMGNPSDPPSPSKNWVSIGKEAWDGHQMFFATPLTKVQMAKLGFDTTQTTAVPGEGMPGEFKLHQNFPNPFNPTTEVEFHLPASDVVSLKVYNLLGAEVKTILGNESLDAGTHTIKFNAEELSSGIYLYRLTTSRFNATRKMVLLK
ncbi:MAG: T9SS type A sorting domain-containing protein [Ignavibacteriae bacterium]|nr:T9SS type A sorting domain-containing protein [Ignavibacteriota bacterium]